MKTQDPNCCERCGATIFLRELPSGRMVAYESSNVVHRCSNRKRSAGPAVPEPKAQDASSRSNICHNTFELAPKAAPSSSRENEIVRTPVSRSQSGFPKASAKRGPSDLEWNDKLLRQSVLDWYETRAAQFVLALPGNDEIVIRYENDDWYVHGRIEGTELTPKFFGTLREALAYAEKKLLTCGKRLLVLLRRENGRKATSATFLQRRILRDIGLPVIESGLTRSDASEMIRRCVTGGV